MQLHGTSFKNKYHVIASHIFKHCHETRVTLNIITVNIDLAVEVEHSALFFTKFCCWIRCFPTPGHSFWHQLVRMYSIYTNSTDILYKDVTHEHITAT